MNHLLATAPATSLIEIRTRIARWTRLSRMVRTLERCVALHRVLDGGPSAEADDLERTLFSLARDLEAEETPLTVEGLMLYVKTVAPRSAALIDDEQPKPRYTRDHLVALRNHHGSIAAVASAEGMAFSAMQHLYWKHGLIRHRKGPIA